MLILLVVLFLFGGLRVVTGVGELLSGLLMAVRNLILGVS